MKMKIGRVRSVALLLVVASLLVLPVTSFAQSDVFNRDFNIGGGVGAGSCTIDTCTQDYCGCSPTQVGGTYVLVSWDCTCSDTYCDKNCNYAPRE
jgi:hypothetical protein